MKRCFIARSTGLLIAATACFVTAENASAQAQTAVDGPWAGWAQCVLTGQFTGQGQTYFHEQTHTWQLTSSTPGPTSSAAIKQYAATWQVTGHGTRQRGQGNNSDQWTTAGQPMPDTITIRLTAEGTVRFGGAAQLRSVGTTTGAVIPYVDEWTFPVIEGAATLTSITGSAPQGLSANFPGAPPGTTSTVTCSWNFVRGGAVSSAPSGAAGPTPILPVPIATASAGPAPTPIVPVPIASATAGPAPANTTATAAPVNVTTTSPDGTASTATSPTAQMIGPTAQRQVFTASGAFTVPYGVSSLTVELWGGGAGGASSTSSNVTVPPWGFSVGTHGHGGGGGAYTHIVLQVSPGTTIGIVVGAAGTGGAGTLFDCCAKPSVDGTAGSPTQLTRNGTVLAEAAGGQADGKGGLKSSASGIVALAGLDATLVAGGTGGAAVSGSITPPVTNGGDGGAAPLGGCSYGIRGMTCDNYRHPGSGGRPGYALISWEPLTLRAP